MVRTTSIHSLCHPIRVDEATFAAIKKGAGSSALRNSADLPGDMHVLEFSPIVFAHAYTLLGASAKRFTEDLRLYLLSVRELFATMPASRSLVLAESNSDSRRRLSEDLGVAMAALLLVETLGVRWESISQIPLNNKLSKKRPDFQGFASNGDRYLFEAKGTTQLAGVEKALRRAEQQVKEYPEQAANKFAVATYVCCDTRMFPSSTFVVDPPVMPDRVPPTSELSVLLHAEKVLQFAGAPATAALYIRTLAKALSSETATTLRTGAGLFQVVQRSLERERRELGLTLATTMFGRVLGRSVHGPDPMGLEIFMGVREEAVMRAASGEYRSAGDWGSRASQSGSASVFSDGTVLIVNLRENDRTPISLPDHVQPRKPALQYA